MEDCHKCREMVFLFPSGVEVSDCCEVSYPVLDKTHIKLKRVKRGY